MPARGAQDVVDRVSDPLACAPVGELAGAEHKRSRGCRVGSLGQLPIQPAPADAHPNPVRRRLAGKRAGPMTGKRSRSSGGEPALFVLGLMAPADSRNGGSKRHPVETAARSVVAHAPDCRFAVGRLLGSRSAGSAAPRDAHPRKEKLRRALSSPPIFRAETSRARAFGGGPGWRRASFDLRLPRYRAGGNLRMPAADHRHTVGGRFLVTCGGMMFSTIIAGVDGRDSGRDAIALASALPSATSARLILAHGLILAHVVCYGWHPARAGSVQARKRALGMLAAEARTLGVDARPAAITEETAAHGIARIVAAERADLVVVGPPHRGRLGRVLIGDDARAVLDAAGCPVALIPRGWRSELRPPWRVGVGYDGTPQARRALPWRAPSPARRAPGCWSSRSSTRPPPAAASDPSTRADGWLSGATWPAGSWSGPARGSGCRRVWRPVRARPKSSSRRFPSAAICWSWAAPRVARSAACSMAASRARWCAALVAR